MFQWDPMLRDELKVKPSYYIDASPLVIAAIGPGSGDFIPVESGPSINLSSQH